MSAAALGESFVLVPPNDAAPAPATAKQKLRILTTNNLSCSAPDLSRSPHTPLAFARIGAALATSRMPSARGKLPQGQQQQQQQQQQQHEEEEVVVVEEAAAPAAAAEQALAPAPASRALAPRPEVGALQQLSNAHAQHATHPTPQTPPTPTPPTPPTTMATTLQQPPLPQQQQPSQQQQQQQQQQDVVLRKLQSDAVTMATELKQANTAIAQLQRELREAGHGGADAPGSMGTERQVPEQQPRNLCAVVEGDAGKQADVVSFVRRVPLVRVLLACPTMLLLPCVLMVLLLLLLLAFHVDVSTMASNFLLLTLQKNGARSLRATQQSDDALHFPTNTGGKGSL